MKTIYTSFIARSLFILFFNCQLVASTQSQSKLVVKEEKSQIISLKKIYPNPVKDYLYIELSTADKDGEIKIEIYNMLGSVIYKKKFLNIEDGYQKIKLNLAELHSGIYIIKLEKNKKAITTKIRKQ